MIKFLVMDVDGTLTDGKIYMGNLGEVFKAFDIKDGCGIKDILPNYGIIPVVITARKSELLKRRCDELGIGELHQGVRNKLSCLSDIIEKYNNDNYSTYDFSNCAYIGDDILDLQCMKPISEAGGIVGCPFDAVESVRQVANFISNRKCGEGAVREFIEHLVCTDDLQSEKISSKVDFAISYINSLDFNNLELGKYEVNDEFFYMVQEYTTKNVDECKLESHKKYIDIQWIIEGSEKIQVADIHGLSLLEDYDFDKDVMFWESPKNICECILTDNSFIVLYPQNAHKPSIMVNEPKTVKKIVCKILI